MTVSALLKIFVRSRRDQEKKCRIGIRQRRSKRNLAIGSEFCNLLLSFPNLFVTTSNLPLFHVGLFENSLNKILVSFILPSYYGFKSKTGLLQSQFHAL
jgi:hypothetical protein